MKRFISRIMRAVRANFRAVRYWFQRTQRSAVPSNTRPAKITKRQQRELIKVLEMIYARHRKARLMRIGTKEQRRRQARRDGRKGSQAVSSPRAIRHCTPPLRPFKMARKVQPARPSFMQRVLFWRERTA